MKKLKQNYFLPTNFKSEKRWHITTYLFRKCPSRHF